MGIKSIVRNPDTNRNNRIPFQEKGSVDNANKGAFY